MYHQSLSEHSVLQWTSPPKYLGLDFKVAKPHTQTYAHTVTLLHFGWLVGGSILRPFVRPTVSHDHDFLLSC